MCVCVWFTFRVRLMSEHSCDLFSVLYVSKMRERKDYYRSNGARARARVCVCVCARACVCDVENDGSYGKILTWP